MDSLEFIGIIAVFASVLVWYLRHAAKDGGGVGGLLGLRPDEESPDASEKDGVLAKPRYRARESSRYRIKHGALRYRQKRTERP